MIINFIGFKALTLLGCWMTNEISHNKFWRNLYWVYTATVIINFFTLYFFQLIYIILEFNNDKEGMITDVIKIHLSILYINFKIKLLVWDRNSIISLAKKCNEPLMIAKSESMILVEKKANKIQNILRLCL